MLGFFWLLMLAAAFQIFGGIASWFFVKRFCKNMKAIVFVEILLMIAVSILLIEESIKITFLSIAGVIAGIAAICLLNKTIPHRHETKAERIGLLVFVAMCFHEFPEGIAFGASYLIDPSLGIITAAMIAMHNIPEGSIVSIPYFIKKKFALGVGAVLATQALYVGGGLAVFLLFINVSQQIQALAVAFAAGAMLYIVFEEFFWAKECKTN